jgi:hypothetical protein
MLTTTGIDIDTKMAIAKFITTMAATSGLDGIDKLGSHIPNSKLLQTNGAMAKLFQTNGTMASNGGKRTSGECPILQRHYSSRRF